jgi:hypothetical protein
MAKLTPFCKRTKSFFVEFPPKEALKKQVVERLHHPKPKDHTETYQNFNLKTNALFLIP